MTNNMENRASDSITSDEQIIELTSALEASGLSNDSYRLYDYIDPEVLVKLRNSLNGPYRICIQIKHYEVTISEHGVLSTSRVQPIQDDDLTSKTDSTSR